jgi:hypothetical protein
MKKIYTVVLVALMCLTGTFSTAVQAAELDGLDSASAYDKDAADIAQQLVSGGDVNIGNLPAHCRDGLTRGEYGCCYIMCPNMPRVPRHTLEWAQACWSYASRQCSILSKIGCGAVWYFGPGFRDGRPVLQGGAITHYCRRNTGGIIRLNPVTYSN